ncbi:thiamine phosphate synthase [Novosphingobium sp. M1R2S20]|uniref:Thiamine phosphate synthase n=1 Tax=Novosphingobium rhizovicinum TaxID=3228928 RepID=A0ABV3RB99_9SPHN
MARCYSACVRNRYPPCTLPSVWLISDERIDERLESALSRLPRGSGFIFRHYHLSASERRARFRSLRSALRKGRHLSVLADTPAAARRWGAAGAYGRARKLSAGPALLRLVTAHSLREIGEANRIRADAVLLSPVHPTRTHPGAPSLGPVRYRLLAARSRVPVIALGGMNASRARALGARHWAAIESLAQPRKRPFPIHS